MVRHQRVADMLGQVLYAGYIERPNWGISLRPAQHEGLISFETFQQIQNRLNGGVYAPRRKNLNEDFPLRGFVACAHCATPLTACWSKGRTARHPYYLCPKRGCESYGKSIRRDAIEGQFETFLKSLTPSDALFKVATAMFRNLWKTRLARADDQRKALATQLVTIEKQVQGLLDRIVDASIPSVISAYEERIRQLDVEKIALRERMASAGQPKHSFEKGLRTALTFLSNPWNLWSTGRLEDRRMVMKLAFVERLQYARGEGLRTANLSLPFKALASFSGEKKMMVRPRGIEPLFPP